MKKYEECSQCNALTDKAGLGEDSIYIDCGSGIAVGPLCDECYEAIKQDLCEATGIIDSTAEVTRLRTELEKLRAMIQELIRYVDRDPFDAVFAESFGGTQTDEMLERARALAEGKG